MEILYRGWDGKRMFTVDVMAICPCGWDSPDYGTRGVSLAYQPHIKVMQYSGVNDEAGEKAFSGDIISCNYDGFIKFHAVVKNGEYEQDGSGGEYTASKCIGFYAEAINPLQENEYGIRIIPDYLETNSLLEFDAIKIIGNIYENPELLQEVQS